MDKILILNKLYKYKKFKTKTEFALFLGITPQALNGWYTRNFYDANIILKKFPEVSQSWILSGNGDMFNDKPQQVSSCKTGKILPMNLANINLSISEYASNNELFDYRPCDTLDDYDFAYQIQSNRLRKMNLLKGDWILLKEIKTEQIKIGSFYLIDTRSYGKMIKRVDYNDNVLMLSLPKEVAECGILNIEKTSIQEEILGVYDIVGQIRNSSINFADDVNSDSDLVKQHGEFISVIKTIVKNQETTLQLLQDAMEIIKKLK